MNQKIAVLACGWSTYFLKDFMNGMLSTNIAEFAVGAFPRKKILKNSSKPHQAWAAAMLLAS